MHPERLLNRHAPWEPGDVGLLKLRLFSDGCMAIQKIFNKNTNPMAEGERAYWMRMSGRSSTIMHDQPLLWRKNGTYRRKLASYT